MTLKFQLKSGRKLELDIATIDNGLRLYRSILIECKGAGLDLNITEVETLQDVLFKNMEALLNVLSSEMVMEAVKDCCSKVIYNNQKFNMSIFENIENRQDFFSIMAIVAIENLRPFFASPHIVLDALASQFLMS